MRTVPAVQGVQWAIAALRILARHFGLLITLALLLVLLTQIPLLGGLISLLFGPALLGGMVWAVHQIQNGRRPGLGALFKAFDGTHSISSLVALCLPSLGMLLLLAFAVGGIVVSSVGGDPAKIQAMRQDPIMLLAALRGHLLPLAILVVLGSLLNSALTFFAVPQVMLRNQTGWMGMRQSLAAAWSNWRALLLLVGAVFGLVFATVLALQLLLIAGGSLGAWWRDLWLLLLVATLYAYSAVLMYVAWHDVLDESPTGPALTTSSEIHAEM